MNRCTGTALAAVAVAIVTLAACTNEGAPTARTTTTPPASGTTAAVVTSPSPASPSTAVPTKYVGSAPFRSPSGRIGCVVSTTAAACDVAQPTYTPPPKPADCDGDFGGGAYVEAGRAKLVCATDTLYSADHPVLPYGASLQVGRFRCTSARDGVRCVRTGSQDGFRLSQSSYSLRAERYVPAAAPPAEMDARYAAELDFATPSGNIACAMVATFASCTIERATFTAPRPSDCPTGRFPSGAVASTATSYLTCGAEPNKGFPVLAYGSSLRLGNVTCRSDRDGVRCVAGSHSLLLSAARYELT